MKKTHLFIILLVFINFQFLPTEATSSEYQNSFYTDIDSVFPGQARYSNLVVQQKINEHIEKGEVIWNGKSLKWSLKYCDGNSLFPLHKALPVVKASYGYLLVDGHHHFLTNLAFEGTCIPISIIADLSDLSEETIASTAKEKGWTYPYDIYGNEVELPKNFSDLEDDPNRFFASLCKRMYSNHSDITKSKGAEYPIWIKIGKDIPFIEMKIAETLWNAGLIYNEELEADIQFYEQVRNLLKEANIPGLRVIPERIHFTDIDLLALTPQ